MHRKTVECSVAFLASATDHGSGLPLATTKNVSTLGRCSQSWETDATLNLFKNCRSMLNKGDHHSSLIRGATVSLRTLTNSLAHLPCARVCGYYSSLGCHPHLVSETGSLTDLCLSRLGWLSGELQSLADPVSSALGLQA